MTTRPKQTAIESKRRSEPSSLPRFLGAALLAATLAGCAAAPSQRAVPEARSAQRSDLPPEALLSLNEIAPARALPTTRPTTQSAVAPLDALVLYAQARKALQAGQRFSAVQLLEKAIELDPDSFELHMMLGQAATGTTVASGALPALNRAVEINPDNTEVYLHIARAHAQGGNEEQAIRALRDAQSTSGYRDDADIAIAVDYQLARTLEAAGYDTAALELYERFLARLPRLSAMYRGPLEVMQVVHNPDLVFHEIAEVAARLGDYPTAISAIEQAMLQNPESQEYAILRIEYLQRAGRRADARQFIPLVIDRYGASVAVMGQLREAWASAGGEKAAIAPLRRAYEANPASVNLGVALAEILAATGDLDAARDVLERMVARVDYRQDAANSLFDFYESQGRVLDAARVLVAASARRPEQLSEISLRMARLTRLSRSNHLRLRDLQNLQIESWAEPARQYWVARLAEQWNRDELARSVLEKAVRAPVPYRPAFRALANHYWSRREWDDQRKSQTSLELAMLASMQGDESLAHELRGMVALRQSKPSEAAAALLESMRDGASEPDVQLAYALVQQMQGNVREAERTLLKINEDFPLFEQAYTVLMNFYLERGSPTNALRTLQRWLAADPRSPTARLYQADIFRITQRTDAAEKLLLELFEEYADNQQVLLGLQRVYAQSGRLDRFIALLEQKRAGRPDIREVAEYLLIIYASQGRNAEATRVLEDLRRSAAGDSDLLYYVSGLYHQMEDTARAHEVLEEVLRVDPTHSSASNDLGYFLAEENRDLDRAMTLVELAVKAEPDNQAFLDSLGWVLYKLGRFEEAKTYLERAIAQTLNPDPVVLDHLGDASYRVGEKDLAVKRWEEASRALATQPLRSDMKNLGAVIQTKLRQHRAGQPVPLAPTAEEYHNSRSEPASISSAGER